jgi:hypothetical protein
LGRIYPVVIVMHHTDPDSYTAVLAVDKITNRTKEFDLRYLKKVE